MDIAVIGAGAMGLTIAYELSKQHHNVTVFEGDSLPGGLAATIKVGDTDLEKYYHHIFTTDTDLIDLINELGLKDKLMWLNSNSGIYINNKLYPFSTPMDLMNFKELSLFDRFLMGLIVIKSKFIGDWKSLENITAKDWIIKKSSKKVYEKVWGPLLKSKFEKDAEEISAVWIWNKFKLRGSTRSKTAKNEVLGYMEGSFGIIYRELAKRIVLNGGSIKYSNSVRNIKKVGDKIKLSGNEEEMFDKVIVTAAPSILKDITSDLPNEYINRLNSIEYKSNICMTLELKNPISNYYWITVAKEEYPFVLMIEHTNLVSKDKYRSNIVYLSRYLDKQNPIYSYDNDKIASVFIDSLKKMFPGWDENDILNYHINKSLYAQPTIYRNYSRLKLDYKTPIQNLYTINMSHIYPEDRGQNYAVKYGKEFAQMINKQQI